MWRYPTIRNLFSFIQSLILARDAILGYLWGSSFQTPLVWDINQIIRATKAGDNGPKLPKEVRDTFWGPNTISCGTSNYQYLVIIFLNLFLLERIVHVFCELTSYQGNLKITCISPASLGECTSTYIRIGSIQVYIESFFISLECNL